jgi:sugar lactone lactonase YvrE
VISMPWSACLSILAIVFPTVFTRQRKLTQRVIALTAVVCGLWTSASAQTRSATITTLAVTSNASQASTVASGGVVTLTATVKASGTALTTGQVNFCDASANYCTDIHLLGTTQLTSAGTASLKFRPGLGSHSYKAVFVGTNSYTGSASNASALTVTGTLPLLATAETINQTGGWGAYTLSATVTESGNTAPPAGLISFLDTNHGNAVLATGTLGSATRDVAWTNVNTSAPNLAGVYYAVADLNGDGIPDLFVQDYFGTYDVFLGNGDGTFKVKGSAFGPSSQTGSFILGDFNNDGIPDVAAVNAGDYAPTGNITIFLGNGDGTFTTSGSSPAIGYNPTAIATADINGDGNADLIVVQQGSSTSSDGQVAIFFGKGDGTFIEASSTTSLASVASSVLPADLNDDGHVDLVLSGLGASGIAILLGKGDGTFTSVADLPQAGEATPVVADLNNDGFPDLVFGAAGASYLTVFLGDGDGTFTEAPSSPNGNLVIGNSLAIADFNQDGIPDVVYVDGNATGILFGEGDGNFVQFPATLTFDTYGFGTAFVVADFNGDGWPDVLAIDGSGRTIADSLTQPTETATATATVSIAAAGQHLVDASYPGDSNYDAGTSGTVSLWGAPPETTTTLTVTSGSAQVTSVTPGSVVVLTGTVSAGGAPVTAGQVNFCDASASQCTDIHLLGTVALASGGTATYKFVPGPGAHNYKAVFVKNGYGLSSSSTVATLTVGPAPSVVYTDTAAISLSGIPGDYSLTATVVGYGGSAPPTGNVSFLDTSFGNRALATASLGSGTAGLGLLVSQTPAASTNMYSEETADFNGDGIPDLALLGTDNIYNDPPFSITILFGKGDGTFTSGPTTQLPASASIVQMKAGDFNGDGKADIAFLTDFLSYPSGATVITLLGNGIGTFTVTAASTVVLPPQDGGDVIQPSMVTADFNGDGKLDLGIVGNYIYGGVSILLGNGDGTFTATAANPEENRGLGLIATGDFNGDGIPDLVVSDYFSPSATTVLLGKGDGTFIATEATLSTDTFAQSAVTGDFNGDGKVDIAIGLNGGVEVYLGNGDGSFSQPPGSPFSGSGLKLHVGDFNQDGKLDLAAIDSYSDAITILLGAGDGTFTLAPTNTAGSLPSGTPSDLVSGDFNQDGITDLSFVTRYISTASILLTKLTETATATVNGIAPVGAGTHNVDASYSGNTNYRSSVSSTVALTAALAPLTISPASGSYSTEQTITISESVPGATIYYSAFGIVNTIGFVPYTGPILLSEGGVETIYAYATETGYQQANSVISTFTINLPAAPAPVFTPAAGTYPSAQTVTISDSVAGATIYYTTNGSWPTTGSTLYSGPIAVSSSETLAAIAIAPGYSQSGPASAQYLLDSSSTSYIYDIAGNGTAGYSGDGGPATTADLNYASGTALDSAGNLYIADSNNNVVRKVAAGTGIISTIAGNGLAGYSGDGGAAASAELYSPLGLAFDSAGNLYVSDSGNNVIRKISAASGIISTCAGGSTTGVLGDNGPATEASLGYPQDVAVDTAGNLYIPDTEHQSIRKVTTSTGIITTVAGGNQSGFSGDGGLATSARLSDPAGIAVDSAGNLYIADQGNNVIRKVSSSNGVISTVVGNSSGGSAPLPGYSGDGGPATSAQLNGPEALALDSTGNLYIADTFNSAIRKVTASSGIITTVAGNISRCNAVGGDGGPATSTALCYPWSVSVDNTGNLYIANAPINRIVVATVSSTPPTAQTAAPTFSVSAGSYAAQQTVTVTDATPGAAIYITMDGSAPTTLAPGYNGPISVTGAVTIKAIAVAPHHLTSAPVSAAYTITTPSLSVISTVAGSNVHGFSGAGGPATSAQLGSPQWVAIDGAGNLYISDAGNSVVWMVSAKTGEISVAAGNGAAGYSGDGGLAISAELSNPQGIALDSSGNLYIADANNNTIRKVAAATGLITTIAGQYGRTGYPGNTGDGGLATAALLNDPLDVVLDSAGNLYIADSNDQAIRMISVSTGIITSVAGNGNYGFSGDGGPATGAAVANPTSLAIDSAGNLYIGTPYVGRIRKVTVQTGVITTVAGDGDSYGNSGDGGLATASEIYPMGLAVDSAGNLYLSNWISTVREVVASTGLIRKVVGTGYAGFSGDGGSPTIAEVQEPQGLVFDASGNLYIADSGNFRIRKVTSPGGAVDSPIFSLAAGAYTAAQSLTITDAAAGATIYYTTDGTTPTTASTKYTAAIPVSTSETIQAIAAVPGYGNSGVTSEMYVIGATAATPVFTPVAGTYTSARSVTLAEATPGATIYYTTNGSAPNPTSTKYTGTIAVSTTETIEAIAVAGGYFNSAVAKATYTIGSSATSALHFIPVTPCRIADTRKTTGAFGGPELASGATRTFDVPQSGCGVPSAAVAYSLNATVVPIQGLGFLTLWPAGQAQPVVSTLNSDGRVKANATITPAGTNGGVSVYASDATQFILDIDGYFVPVGTSTAGLEFFPVTPCRIADTRNATSALGGPSLAANVARAFPVQSSSCDIPATAQAYSLNITAVPLASLGYLTTWPSGQPQPVVSTLNSSTGAVTADAAIVPAGAGGDISVVVSDASDVILDVNGYFAPPATGGLSLYTVTPCRAIDTRGGSGVFDGTLAVPIQESSCAPPGTAQAYVLNATVVPTASLSYLSLWAAGGTQPYVSTLNASDGAVTSNMAIVPTSNGLIDAFATDSTQLILDLSSYFAP